MKYNLKYPINLDIDAVLKQNTIFPIKNIVRDREKAYIIVDAVMNSMLSSYEENEYDNNTKYHSLSSIILKDAMHDYSHYLTLLITAGVIETDNTYQVGFKCKGYCFTDTYNVYDYKTYTVTQYTLIKAITRQRKKINRQYLENLRGYDYITKWFKTGKLEINVQQANQWIANNKAIELTNVELPVKGKIKNSRRLLTTEEKVGRINNREARFKHLVQDVHNRTFNIKFAGEGHRFYSPLTRLKKELRNYLTYDGQQLAHIDISNSQPYFAILLHDINFWEKFKKENKKKEENKGIDRTIRFLKSAETPTDKGFQDEIDLYNTKSSINYYIESVTNGTFYEQLKNGIQPLFPDKFYTYGEVKTEVLRMMYVENKFTHLDFYAPMQQVFKQMFPATYYIYTTLKSIKCKTKDNYFPVLLQKIESGIMIDNVCKRINQQYPDIPLFTIHDSIVTTISNQAIVTEIMKNTIKERVGYEPQVKVEILIPLEVATLPQNPHWISNTTKPTKAFNSVVNATTRKSFKVVNKATGQVFNTIKEAAANIGLNYNSCRNMLSGANKNKTPLKYILQ